MEGFWSLVVAPFREFGPSPVSEGGVGEDSDKDKGGEEDYAGT